MQKNNFKCRTCNFEFTIPAYRQIGDKYYETKRKKLLECPKCTSIALTYVKTLKGVCTTFGKFASASPSEKQAILKQRAREHSKKHIPQDRDIKLDNNFNIKR